jgi:ribonucleoside-diphosphate reductase alpha chain
MNLLRGNKKMAINVTKRDGRKEELNISKLHRVVQWACEDIAGVSESEIEIKTQMQFFDGMKTSDIQEALIKAAHELITEDAPNYQFVAGRLVNYALRKDVYGSITPPRLYDHVKRVVDAGFYDEDILDWYTEEEFDQMDKWIDHDRDFLIAYAGMEQMRGKYLVRNRETKQFYETPQVSFMLIAATLFHRYEKNSRLKWVSDLYDAISEFDISLPTPIMAGVRTPKRQFSSCVLIEVGDSLDSIIASTGATVKYVANRAGIGLGMGNLRGLDVAIRNGDAIHTGNIAFYKLLVSALKSCSQGGVRGGSGTIYHPIWHSEIQSLLVLKNNKGTEDNRIRHVDYGVQFNRLMLERLIEDGNITLFSPKSVPGLYDAFFQDQDKFRELYEEAERNPKIKKEVVKASDLFNLFMQERKDTGRIYSMFVDNVNSHGAFLPDRAPIRMSNLCAEISLPTKPLDDLHDKEGEIALCTLAAENWGRVRRPEDFKRPARLLVRALDELLDFQDYPVIAAQVSTMNRRPLGIGIINFAYFLAKNGITYQDVTKDQLRFIDDYAEAWSYYLIRASVELARDKGQCPLSKDTKYHNGILPIDTYSKEVDELTGKTEFTMPWEELRSMLRDFGIRNSTLMALMPAETSAQVSNSTNGIEPPRALVSVKGSKDGHLKQVVPEVRKLKNKYDLLWDQKSPRGYLKIMAVLQKYIDQCISVNTSYNPKFYLEGKIPMSELLTDFLLHYKWGGKTLYYMNTADSAGEEATDEKMTEWFIAQDEDESCDSCKI